MPVWWALRSFSNFYQLETEQDELDDLVFRMASHLQPNELGSLFIFK